MKKRILSILLVLVILTSAVVLASCDNGPVGPSGDTGASDGGNKNNDDGNKDDGNKNNDKDNEGNNGGESSGNSADRYTNYDLNAEYDEGDSVKVSFTDSKAEITGDGAAANGTVVTITKAGTYILSGSCEDGQVIVEVAKEEKVQLVLDGLKLICKSSAPIYVKSADKTLITLKDGTTSTIQDGSAYKDLNADEEPNACIFSKDDLTINGEGTLNVYANFNNGIVSKDDLKVISGTVSVTAKNHGIRGNDSVTIKDGAITISCKNDGIKSSKADEAGKGYIYIDGGTFNIDCGDDAFQAPVDITIVGGKYTVEAGGNILNCDGTVNVADGLLPKE